nr:hypothetical protein [Marseillevirus cajuinensis]
MFVHQKRFFLALDFFSRELGSPFLGSDIASSSVHFVLYHNAILFREYTERVRDDAQSRRIFFVRCNPSRFNFVFAGTENPWRPFLCWKVGTKQKRVFKDKILQIKMNKGGSLVLPHLLSFFEHKFCIKDKEVVVHEQKKRSNDCFVIDGENSFTEEGREYLSVKVSIPSYGIGFFCWDETSHEDMDKLTNNVILTFKERIKTSNKYMSRQLDIQKKQIKELLKIMRPRS